jgi:hypothetical protein
MRGNSHNKYTIFTDRFPFIIVAVILVFAVFLIFQLKSKYPLPFFSASGAKTQIMASIEYPILIASPTDEEVFDFVSKNMYVPIEIKSKAIEGLDYKLNLVINEKDIIKTFSAPPYRYDWHPAEPGEYTIVANLMDSSNQTLSSSKIIRFVVKLKYEDTPVTQEAVSINTAQAAEAIAAGNIPTIRLEVFEGPAYSAGEDICYYRIKAIVTGDPAPVVSFSKDDSAGAWGPLNTQINLTRNTPSYTLTATARNSAGQALGSITLNWGCGTPE